MTRLQLCWPTGKSSWPSRAASCRRPSWQLSKLIASETSITEASQSYLKSFFQKRGLYITEALLVVFVVVRFCHV